eukprot:6175563-Pleurochrysis_carterae.AAC.2
MQVCEALALLWTRTQPERGGGAERERGLLAHARDTRGAHTSCIQRLCRCCAGDWVFPDSEAPYAGYAQASIGSGHVPPSMTCALLAMRMPALACFSPRPFASPPPPPPLV